MTLAKAGLIALALWSPGQSGAMEVRVAGNQLILSGGVTGDEIAKMRDILPANPQIDTVVLKDSLGGDVWTAFRLGELFEEKRFRTAASGYCMSACVVIFLGGRERSFADGKPGNLTFLAVHTPTAATDSLRDMKGAPLNSARGQLFSWMGKRLNAGGDLELLKRALGNDDPAGFMYFFDIGRKTRKDGVTAFHCKGPEKKKIADCEPLPATNALSAGLVTTETILQVNQ
jgi:hypothetical protein